jgi:hypothetical protein
MSSDGIILSEGDRNRVQLFSEASSGADGNLQINCRDDSAPVKTLYISGSSGNAYLRGTLAQCASDKKLKENIKKITYSLKKVKEIRGVEFDWKKGIKNFGQKGHDVGVIAQEVEKVLPEAVTTAPFNGDYLTVRYEKIVPLLVEAIKELSEKVEELESKISDSS